MVCCFDPPAELDDLLQLLRMRKVSAAASQPATTPIPNGASQRSTIATISPLAPTMTVRRVAGGASPAIGRSASVHSAAVMLDFGLPSLKGESMVDQLGCQVGTASRGFLAAAGARRSTRRWSPLSTRTCNRPVGRRRTARARIEKRTCQTTLLLPRGSGTWKRCCLNEHNVDPAVIVGIGAHNGIVPMRRQCCVQPSTSRSTTESVATTRTPSKSRPWPGSWPRSPRRAGRSCDHSDDQDHLIDPAHHCGAGEVPTTVPTIIKVLSPVPIE
jgi:hypothetical protein